MKTFAEIYESMKDTLEYQVEELSLAFTESVLLRMEEIDGMSRKELSERMETSMAYVTKLLKGKSNFTLETLVKLARALDCRIAPPVLIPNAKRTPSAQVIQFSRRPRPQFSIPFSPREVVTTRPTVTVTESMNDKTSEPAAA